MAGYASIMCKVQNGVGHLVLHRPAKSNSISKQMWEELPRGLDWLLEQGARVVRCLAQPPPRPLPPAACVLLGSTSNAGLIALALQ